MCGHCASQESHSKQAFCTAGAGVSAFAIAAKLAGVPSCPLGDRHPGSASWGREAGPPFSSSSRLPASARLPQQPQGPSHPGKASTKHAHCTVCSVRRCLREYHTFAGLLSRVALPCGPSSLRLPLCALRLECSSLWICLLVSILHQIRISSVKSGGYAASEENDHKTYPEGGSLVDMHQVTLGRLLGTRRGG